MSTDQAAALFARSDDALRDVVHSHHPFPWKRTVLWAATLLVAADFLIIVSGNKNFGWPVVSRYLLDADVLQGLYITLLLTIVAMTLGVIFGLPIAIARMSEDKLARGLAWIFVWVFRGTPLLVQLIFFYNLSFLFPRISIAVPFGPTLVSWATNDVITPLTAACLGLALNEAAYMAEIIRAGILSVDRNQVETAEAYGMSRGRTLRRIVLPQAMRAIVPPTGNQLISMIKATSLVSVIAMADLLYSVQTIYNRTFEIIPLLLVAVFWYLAITSILNVIQGRIERYYGRGHDRSAVVADLRQDVK